MTTRQSRPRPPMTARLKIMDLLARRDHSEKELRQKLKLKFEAEEIEAAIEYAKEKNWIPSSEEDLLVFSEKVADILRRKGKGIQYINQYLRKKGLLPVLSRPKEELEKAVELVENKFFRIQKKNPPDRTKVGRFLMSRGFSSDIVRKVIYGNRFKFQT
jgi:regulatory protein